MTSGPTSSGARWWRPTRWCAGSAPSPPAGSAITARRRSWCRLLSDPDSTVRVAAAFALGLLRDSAAVQPLIDRLTGLPALDAPTAVEAVTALAKIGGRRSGDFFAACWAAGSCCRRKTDPAFNQVLAESWRLGRDAPVTGLLPFMEDTAPLPRLRAAYSLGRLRAAPRGQPDAARAARSEAYIRSLAARALTRTYVESAGLAPSAVADLLLRAADDPSPAVRINAIRSLGGYGDPPLGSALSAKLTPTARRSAGRRAGAGGRDAGRARRRRTRSGRSPGAAGGKGTFALRRSRPGGTRPRRFRRVRRRRPSWRDERRLARPRRRRGGHGARGAGPVPWFLADRDGRVVAAGLQAWAGEVEGPDAALLAAARPLLGARRTPLCGASRPMSSPGPPIRPISRPLAADVRRHRPRLLSRCRALGPGRHPRDPEAPAPAAQARVDREFLLGARPAAELSAPAVGRGQLARGGGTLGTGAPDRHRAVAAGLPRPRPPLPHRPRFAGAAACHHRDRAARAGRGRAARARRAAHGGQLPPAGRPPVLRRQPLASRRAQLRRPGRRSRAATGSAAPAAPSATRSTATATTARCSAWRSRAPTPA